MNNTASNDTIHRFLFKSSDIRGEIVTLNKSYKDAISAHSLPEALAPIYGQFLVGVTMISEILKFDGIATLQARGDGPIPIIMAESNNHGHLRGVIQCADDAENRILNNDTRTLLPLSELLGNGILSLTLDPAVGKRYQGIVPLDAKDLAGCMQHYFEQSEQVPTHIVLFADAEKCGGIFLQCLPPQNVTDADEREEHWQTAIQLLNTAKAEEFFETDHETLLYRLFHERQCEMFEGKEIEFKCQCSRERSAQALRSLGDLELNKMIEELQTFNIDCQFCGSHYSFTTNDLKSLLAN